MVVKRWLQQLKRAPKHDVFCFEKEDWTSTLQWKTNFLEGEHTYGKTIEDEMKFDEIKITLLVGRAIDEWAGRDERVRSGKGRE